MQGCVNVVELNVFFYWSFLISHSLGCQVKRMLIFSHHVTHTFSFGNGFDVGESLFVKPKDYCHHSDLQSLMKILLTQN